jgi:hypothetical protein
MEWRVPQVAVLGAFLAYSVWCQQFEVPDWGGMRWYKGNTHSHSDLSDGDSPSVEITAWYKAHGYDFVVITDSDHMLAAHPGPIDLGAPRLVTGSLLLVPGVQLSDRYLTKPVFVGALNVPCFVKRAGGSTIVDMLQRDVSAVRDAGAVPVVCHPNKASALDQETLLAVSGYSLLEIFNGDYTVQNDGIGGSPSVEQMWDYLLSAGRRAYGIAADDAHCFNGACYPPIYPGTGWVAVRARSLNADEIFRNLDRGLFYASTGVVLEDVLVEAHRIAIKIVQEQGSTCSTEFIGAGGKVLLQTTANPADYKLAGGESYVRARVTDSSGRRAWVQPVFVRP